MHPLKHPLIIDRIFEFLPVFEIDQCQYVCQAWQESALRRLEKCPLIDRCQLEVRREIWSPSEGKFLVTYYCDSSRLPIESILSFSKCINIH